MLFVIKSLKKSLNVLFVRKNLKKVIIMKQCSKITRFYSFVFVSLHDLDLHLKNA